MMGMLPTAKRAPLAMASAVAFVSIGEENV